jgi:hypothetical protein
VTEETAVYMTAPTKNGEAPLPRRGGPKGMLPSTWVSRTLRLEYVGAGGEMQETTATLLDWCGMGPVFNLGGARTVVGWDRLVLCELVED